MQWSGMLLPTTASNTNDVRRSCFTRVHLGAGASSSTWKPNGTGAWTQGYQSIPSQVAYGVLTNALGEFAAEIQKLFRRKGSKH